MAKIPALQKLTHMCSETDFTQEKGHFHPITRIPNSSLLFAAILSQNGRIAVERRPLTMK